MPERARVVHIDELDRIRAAEGIWWRPVRRRLGVQAFGINAYTADGAGDPLIEHHDESGSGAGAHEELYLVVTGRATFTVADEEIDAPAGTLVFVPDLTARRGAVAAEPGTSVVVVGAPPRNAFPVSPWEHWFAAIPAYESGDYARAVEIASEGLRDYPEHPVIHYQLACYHSLAGNREQALEHLRVAFDRDPRAREGAATDTDLDPIRDAIPGS